MSYLRLGVNIDHVATIRNARGGGHPSPVRAAKIAKDAGADGITAHLREDRRHIADEDIEMLKSEVGLPLNMEMAATDEMLEIALRTEPNAVCIVPEKRQELTTEGGLDVVKSHNKLPYFIDKLKCKDIRVSLFVNPDDAQIKACKDIGADIVEIHTGLYCDAESEEVRRSELDRIAESALYASSVGLECHAGHGLSYGTVKPVAAVQQIVELNIGHFLIGEAIFLGLEGAIIRMRELMDEARA